MAIAKSHFKRKRNNTHTPNTNSEIVLTTSLSFILIKINNLPKFNMDAA